MIVSAIVATAHNRVMGKDNDIPWHLPADLNYFKKTTLNHHVIMGRKTFESIGKPLPKRTNIILTKNPFFVAPNTVVTHEIEEALEYAHDRGEEEVFILGGAQIYHVSMPYWDRLYWTEVDAKVEGDTFFPRVDLNEWELVKNEPFKADEKNAFDMKFKLYYRVGGGI